MMSQTDPSQALQPAENDQERLDTLPIPFQAHALFHHNPAQICADDVFEEDIGTGLEAIQVQPSIKMPELAPVAKVLEEGKKDKSLEESGGSRTPRDESDSGDHPYQAYQSLPTNPINVPSLKAGRKEETLEIILSACGIQALPEDFALQYKNLRALDLRENRLMLFPAGITNLEHLTDLRLDYNNIRIVPTNIYLLRKLERLALSNNAITKIEPNIGKLTALKFLILSDNRLDNWPESMCSGLMNLRVLHLHGNPGIPGIPYKFAQLFQLVEFGFDWYLYLNPATNCVLKGLNGKRYMDDTRQVCRYFELKKSSPSEAKTGDSSQFSETHCGFIEFMSWFAGTDSNGLTNYVYSKARNPLHLAAIWGHTAIVKQIIDTDYDINSQDEEGSTALALAIRCNKIEVADILLASSKIDIGISCNKYGTPLHLAIIKGLYSLAEKMANSETVKPNARDANGNTVFHYLLAKFSNDVQTSARICARLTETYICLLNAANNTNMMP